MLTDAEIIRHLGKLCGRETMNKLKPPSYPGSPWEYYDGSGYAHAWNPMESRDDCAEVQAKVPPDKQIEVGATVARMVKEERGSWSGVSDWDMLNITPRGICLAIVEATR